jgi:hypothetical protein
MTMYDWCIKDKMLLDFIVDKTHKSKKNNSFWTFVMKFYLFFIDYNIKVRIFH